MQPLCRVPRLIAPMAASLLLMANALPAQADPSLERENLARIQHELRLLRAQVASAGEVADGAARVRFRYDWLARDLDLIAASIDEHLDAPRQPRAVPPLRGDYRN